MQQEAMAKSLKPTTCYYLSEDIANELITHDSISNGDLLPSAKVAEFPAELFIENACVTKAEFHSEGKIGAQMYWKCTPKDFRPKIRIVRRYVSCCNYEA